MEHSTKRPHNGLMGVVIAVLLAPMPCAAQQVVHVGSGSYATSAPAGAAVPPREIRRTDNAAGPMPTNDWWSSVAWMPLSERQYPHPLAVRAEADGLRVYYPGDRIHADRHAIYGFMPADGGADLTLGHSSAKPFREARVDGFSDWFVSVDFGTAAEGMTVRYGHGSPLVFAQFRGGTARIAFARPPKVWAGDAGDAVLGVTVDGAHYGLFGPSNSTWAGLDGTKWINRAGARRYFSLAVLPEATPEALALVRRYAYAHVVDTRVTWRYEPAASAVQTTYRFTTQHHEGAESGTLFALYPHQWRNTDDRLLPYEYHSVRGAMRLAAGTQFSTRMRYPGVLPGLPLAACADKKRLVQLIDEELAKPAPATLDTYWEGKHLGKLAVLASIAEQCEHVRAVGACRGQLRQRLEGWFTAFGDNGQPKSRGLFCYDDRWGTLIGYPDSFGSADQLNDHHFHYGYYLRAAAELARHDPAWVGEEQWGGMLDVLIRDIAAEADDDPLFPRLRCFDPCAGHSWASGHAKFGDGNNNESSSEAIAAWCGMILLGEATGNTKLRDLGIYLYTTEVHAAWEYWFDVHGDNHHRDFPASVATMIWGGKCANGTWFSANPEAVHGINWLPLHGGSLYLGAYPEYARRNYTAMLQENGGDDWDQWADLIWMYQGLFDPQAAMAQFEARRTAAKGEAGNSWANTYHWLATLGDLGRVDRSVTADCPLFACFRNGAGRTYVVYQCDARPRTVRFSDGTSVATSGKGFVVQRQQVPAE